MINKKSQSDELLYKKIGRRYFPTARFCDEPAEGIWLVTKTSSGTNYRRICRIAELPDIVKLTKLERYRDQLEKYFISARSKWISINDMITDIFSMLAQGDDE